jgi:hypothetical protein
MNATNDKPSPFKNVSKATIGAGLRMKKHSAMVINTAGNTIANAVMNVI